MGWNLLWAWLCSVLDPQDAIKKLLNCVLWALRTWKGPWLSKKSMPAGRMWVMRPSTQKSLKNTSILSLFVRSCKCATWLDKHEVADYLPLAINALVYFPFFCNVCNSGFASSCVAKCPTRTRYQVLPLILVETT